jgi:riboflavin kinase/FMN adenylyltransferase
MSSLRLIRDLDHMPEDFRSGAVSIGNFDGVHRGHARIVERLLTRAAEVGGPAVVFTFDPHPIRILRPQHAPPPLTWTRRKAELLAELGVDLIIAYPTNEDFLRLGARQFFDQIICEVLDAQVLVEGSNFFFGRDRLGNVDTLRDFCAEACLTLDVVHPVEIDGQVVSSSRIRSLVAAGHVDQAAHMLTRPYRIRGKVIRGAGRGADLGYPTANMDHVDTLLPSQGIYAGRALADGRMWPAAMSLGPNPTFQEDVMKVEVHLLDYEGTLYDQEIEVDFLARLRDIVRFNSPDQLVAQMDRDIQATRRLVAKEQDG